MTRFLALLALLLCALCGSTLSALTVTGDITTDTTWTSADSPVLLNPSGSSGGTITVRNGATLTIDTSGGAITVNWNENCDLAIGNGASEQGTLKIKAASGALTFGVKTGGNVRIANNGQLLYTDITATTTFTRFDASNTWGALIFEAGQTRQSEVKKSAFAYGGNDSKNGMIVVDNSSSNTPTFSDVSFSNEPAAGKAAIRFIGNGINTLKEGAFTLPFSVSGVTYVFRIGDVSTDTVTATAPVLHFPDITSPDTPTNLLTGTLAVGDASNCSIVKFDDAYTFKCSASSSTKVKIVNGAIWGSSECQPLFETVSGSPTYTNWAGLVADSTTIANVFDGLGPFAYLTVRNATTGVDINTGTTFIPFSGQQTNWCFPGLVIKKCSTGFRVRTQLDSSGNGYCTILKNADVGDPAATDDCNVNCVLIDYGRVILNCCQLKGSVTNAVNTGTTTDNQRANVTIRDCRISDTATSTTSTAINNNSCQGNCDLTIERTIIEGWRTGVSFFQTSTGGYTPTRTLTMRNCFISGDASGTNISSTGVNIQIQTAAVCTVLIEECTISGVNKTGTGTARGFWLQELQSSSTMTVRRTNIDSNTDYGADVVSAANNTCQYTFDECSFTLNGDAGTDEGGIRDRRTQNAKVVANHCTFAGNNPRGATDNNATQQMLAENCYWNASNGPSGSGPGSGDAVSTNVDYSPFLARPYIGFLTGGAPAGASTLAVGNADGSATLPDQLHIVDDDQINVVWTFASDFNASTQSAYEFDIDDNANFSSLLLNGSKTSSSSTDVTVTPTLAAGTVYYVRLRLWDAKDRIGPWYYATFRTNTAPPQVGDTSRSPGVIESNPATPTINDATPLLVFQRPTDADEDPVHFYVEVDTANTFDTDNLRLANSKQILTNGGFEISTDSGTTWWPLPSTGAPQGQTILIRLTSPTTWPNGLGTLTDTTWYWRVRASDGFQYGSYSTNFKFTVSRSYTFSGKLIDTGGSAVNGATIKVAHNGTVLGVSDDTDASGDYAFTVSDDLKQGDILVFFRDGGTTATRATRVTHFTGDDMSGQDLKYRVIRVTSKLTTAITNAAFTADDGVDADIMWSEASGLVTVGGSAPSTTYTLEVSCNWNVTGNLDCQTNDAPVSILSNGLLRTGTNAIWTYSLDNDGSIEVSNNQVLGLEANSTSSGTLEITGSTLSFDAGGITLTVDRGTFNCRSSIASKSVLIGGNPGTIVVDSATSADPAVVSFQGVVFTRVGLTFETDGLCAQFSNCTFKDGILTRHIHWKCTDSRSATTFRGVQFDYALSQGSEFNVEATSNALVLSMVGCGGARYGEGYDKNGGSEGDSLDNKVLWSLMPPKDIKVLAGDTRNRLEWTTDAQASLSGAGYNVYRSTDPTSAPPWGSPLNGASPITTNSYNDASLSNGTTYWYYVTCVDSNTSPDTESGRSPYVSATPGTPSISSLAPSSTASTSILAMTIVCAKTHMDSNSTVAITTGGGSGLTVNDTIVLSPTLLLTDVTLSSASVATWTVTAARNDVWGISTYDESVSTNLTVSANSNENRPTISFTNPSVDADTSGAFTIGLSYSANSGDNIDTSTLELYASRDVTVQSVNRTAGTNLAQIGSFWDTLNSTTATCNVGQTAATELFANGEYTLTARIGNTTGRKTEWVSRRFYVEGGSSTVAKTTTLLKQGDTSVSVVITGTFSVNVNGVSFGSNITTLSFTKDSGTQVTAVVNVDHLAACGPRTFTVDLASGTDPQGQIVVEYPTNILPAYTNDEPPRNPGIAGLNVFLINGAFFKSETDIATRGRMMGMSWSRFYRSDVACNGPLGNGWLGYYFQRAIYTAGGTDHVSWYAPDGRMEQFDGFNPISGPAGVYANAVVDFTHSTVTITDRHGHKCIFNSQGRLMECVDRHGNKVKLEYNYVGQLIKITDDRGKTWEIVYYSHGRVQKVQDKVWSTGSPREVEYTYDSNGDMIEQKAPTTTRYDGSPKSRVTSGYRYVDHRLTECVNPNEFALGGTPASFMENRYEYDANSGNWRIVAQRLGGQDQWLYLRYVSSTMIREIDRRGLRTDYTIDATGRTTKVERYTKFWSVDTEDPVDHTAAPTEVSGKVRASDPDKYTTDFTYNDNHEVTSVTYPRGNKVAYTYPNPSVQASGTATGISGSVLTDSGASWTAKAFVGMTLRMGTDPSNYRYYPIDSNNATTISVAGVYSLQADGWTNGSTYSVQTNNPDPLAKGNLLKVTRSDEALGSLADIITEYTYENRYQFVKTAKNPRGYTTTYVYDWEDSASQTDAGRGNLVRVEYPAVGVGQPSAQFIKVYMTYNQYGQPVTAVDGEGNVTLYKYYTDGASHDGFLFQRISAQGALDLTSEYDYDNVGNMTAQWPPRAFEPGATKDNFKTTFVVNEFDQVTKVTGPLLRTTGSDRADSFYYYDWNGNLTNTLREYVTDAGSEPSAPGDADDPATFSKSSTEMAATWHETVVKYDILNRPFERTVDAIAGSPLVKYTYRTVYDRSDNVTDSISPLGNRSRTVYDERDMVFQRTAGADSDVAAIYTSNYDANGNVSTSVDARSFSTSYAYDGFDRTTSVTDPAGHFRETDYDVNSNVTETRAKNAGSILLAKTQFTYDELDRTTQVKRLANDRLGNAMGDGWQTSSTLFDKNSRVTESTDDNGVKHYRFYDAASRTLYVRDARGNETRFDYNLDGATTRTTYIEVNDVTNAVEKSHTECTFDYLNRCIKYRDQRYNVSTNDTERETKFDGWSRVTESKDAADITTDYRYDLLSRTVRVSRKPGASQSTWTITYSAYDADSRVSEKGIYEAPDTLSSPQVTRYFYDERSRLTALQRADGDIYTRQYDANSNVIQWSDPEGNVVNNTYDSRNLIQCRNITRGDKTMGGTYECYSFDGLGRLESCSNYENTRLMVASRWEYNTLSLPELYDQTIGTYEGTIYGNYVTKAEYDGAGYRTASVTSSGRRTEITRDSLNRAHSIYDVTYNNPIATFMYAGGRLIERTTGDGTKMSVSYEASGCGCGGYSALVERVEYKKASDGQVLAAVDRRYDKKGNMTAEREDHFGHFGNVFRYDDADRLTTGYYGVTLTGSNLATYSSPSETPSTFALKRTFNLDPRGNRTGSSGVRDQDDSVSPVTIKDTNFTVSSDKMNLYTDIDGKAMEYDAIEQCKRDRSVEHYIAYDYRGLEVARDDDAPSSPLGSPFMVNTHDCLGRLCLTQTYADDAVSGVNLCGCSAFEFEPPCPCPTCAGTAGSGPTGEHHGGAGPANDPSSTFYDYGPNFPIMLSGDASNPLCAVGGPTGDTVGPCKIAETAIENGAFINVFFRAVNQLGSLIMRTNASGARTDVEQYTEHGGVLQFPVAFDGQKNLINSVTSNSPENGITKLHLTSGLLSSGALKGMTLVVSVLDIDSNTLRVGRVVDNDTDDIWVLDDDSIGTAIYHHSAIQNGFVVYKQQDANEVITSGSWDDVTTDGLTTDLIDTGVGTASAVGQWVNLPNGTWAEIISIPNSNSVRINGDRTEIVVPTDPYVIAKLPYANLAYSTAGQWTAENFASGETTLTDSSATFNSYMVGWQIILDMEFPVAQVITAVPTATTLKVAGDVRTLTDPGKFYILFAPPWVDPATGTLAEIITEGEDVDWNVLEKGSLYLWAGYRYMFPMVGFDDGGNTVGAQAGTNKLGNYHCNNRVYSIGHGRWLSPDQAASPFFNLFDYTGHRPTNRSDPSGLFMMGGGRSGLRHGYYGNYDTHQGITARAAKAAGICGPATSYVTDGAMAADGTIWKMIGAKMGFKQSRTNANSVHVDNGDFEGAARWLRNAKLFLEEIAQLIGNDCQCCQFVGPLGFLLGLMCHTIEDFYHHNNFSGFGRSQIWDGVNEFGRFLEGAAAKAGSKSDSAGGPGKIGWGRYDNNDGPEGGGRGGGKYEHSPWEEKPGTPGGRSVLDYYDIVGAAERHAASVMDWAQQTLPCAFEKCECCQIEESNWSFVFGGEPSFADILKRFPSLQGKFDTMNDNVNPKGEGESISLKH
ncbi:MAG: hypothetical protein BroJett014_27710 [Planctomycetota bacterium]|nr:MAG: hypothetical protein BroJett014_27710 [Planctomycetota bacterium]